MMIFLTLSDILKLHTLMVAETGGADGVRNEDLLKSAISASFESYFGVEKYPSVEEKAARLCYGIIKNHPFMDGNKRTGVFAGLTMLEINGIEKDFTQEDIIRLGLKTASGEWGYEEILELFTK